MPISGQKTGLGKGLFETLWQGQPFNIEEERLIVQDIKNDSGGFNLNGLSFDFTAYLKSIIKSIPRVFNT